MQEVDKVGIYEKYIKRLVDFLLALISIVLLSPVILIVALLVHYKLGSPILYKQQRPGLNEKIFTIYKFRTMTDKRDANGELLPDEVRLTKFGQRLRSTSLDELPELFNILKGDMAIVGPRPLLVKDMLFMTPQQRTRHSIRPGLSGLAQINGRNRISWEKKLNYDLEYIEQVTFFGDLYIIFQTFIKAFVKQEDVSDGYRVTAEDLGDYLLRTGQIKRSEYELRQTEIKKYVM